MSEPGMEVRTFVASDGYPLHVTLWRVAQQAAAWSCCDLAWSSESRRLVQTAGAITGFRRL